MNSKTAILYFSRNAEFEAAAKQFSRVDRRNLLVAKALVKQGLRLAQRSGLPFFHVDEQKQTGIDFGSRLQNAVDLVTARGYKQVIIIGNDAPQLRLDDIRKAQKALDRGQSVIGQDQRGGAYLIGLTAEQSYQDLSRLPWQSEQLIATLTHHLASTLLESNHCSPGQQETLLLCEPPQKLVFLRSLIDVNNVIDLMSILQFVRKKMLFLALCFFLPINRAVFQQPSTLALRVAPPILRGPPILA